MLVYILLAVVVVEVLLLLWCIRQLLLLVAEYRVFKAHVAGYMVEHQAERTDTE